MKPRRARGGDGYDNASALERARGGLVGAGMRVRDLNMAQSFNGGEREMEDWVRLIDGVRPGFEAGEVGAAKGECDGYADFRVEWEQGYVRVYFGVLVNISLRLKKEGWGEAGSGGDWL